MIYCFALLLVVSPVRLVKKDEEATLFNRIKQAQKYSRTLCTSVALT